MSTPPWVTMLLGVAMLAPFTVMALRFTRSWQRARTWTRAVGSVVYTDVSRGGTDSSDSYRARYVYADDAGHEHQGVGPVNRDLPPGRELDVLYDPSECRNSQILTRYGAATWALGGFGFLLFLWGCVLIALGVSQVMGLA